MIHDPAVPGLPCALIEAQLRSRRHVAPIVTLGALGALAGAIAALRN